jgi:uracil-DNA glycosylase
MSHICYNKNLFEAKLMMIGRNPGLEDDHSKILLNDFIDKYHDLWWNCRFGKYIRREFGDEFISKNMFFTNISKCSSPENSKLEQNEINNCSEFLLEQIKIIRPKFIVTFGSEAWKLISSFNIDKSKAKKLFHPSYFSYNRDSSIVGNQSKKIKLIMDCYEQS